MAELINKDEIEGFGLIDNTDESADLKETLGKYLFHWPLFALGLVIFLFGAVLYLRYEQPIYTVNSTLLIKDEKKGNMPANGDLLNQLDLFGTSKVVDNEIEILKSKTLMRKVVDRLSLAVSMSIEGRLKTSDLYPSKSLMFSVLELNENYYGRQFTLTFPKANMYLLTEAKTGLVISGKLNTLERNALGVFKIVQDSSVGNTPRPEIAVSINDPRAVADQYLNQLTVGLASKQSTVLMLSIQSPVPEKGLDILNTLIQVYNEAALKDKNQISQSTIQFIDERLKLITGELTSVEKDVESFKSSRGLTDISNDANAFLESVKANDAKLSAINVQSSVVDDIKRYLNSKSPNEKLPTTLGIEDPVLLGQVTQLSQLQMQRDQLLSTTTPNNPVMFPLMRQIETTREAIKSSINNISQALRISKSDLERNSSNFQGSIKKIPGQERQLISIKRQQSIKESLYLYLLQKKEEAALSYASAVADSRIVDSAFYSKVPIRPKKQIVYLAAILLGLVLPAAFIYIRDLFNDKIQTSNDLAKLTSTPLLGDILYNESAEAIVVSPESRKAIAEQFRAIRTNMQFLFGKPQVGKGRVTLLTSSMSGEGKSFVATNIAASQAISGKKTVLLELDLRKPKVSKYLNLTNNKGLSNFLIGQAEINEIVQSSGFDSSLFVIGSGPIPPNPSELLIHSELDVLFNYLLNEFDEIIIDSPPIGLVADAQILSRFADVTIYLVRQNVTLKHQVKQLDQIYKSGKFPRMNVILNGVELGGNYGYGYGYGYGYYSDDFESKRLSLSAIFQRIIKRL